MIDDDTATLDSAHSTGSGLDFTEVEAEVFDLSPSEQAFLDETTGNNYRPLSDEARNRILEKAKEFYHNQCDTATQWLDSHEVPEEILSSLPLKGMRQVDVAGGESWKALLTDEDKVDVYLFMTGLLIEDSPDSQECHIYSPARWLERGGDLDAVLDAAERYHYR